MGALGRSRQVIWMSGEVGLDDYFSVHTTEHTGFLLLSVFCLRWTAPLPMPAHFSSWSLWLHPRQCHHSYQGLCKPKYLQTKKLASRARHLFHYEYLSRRKRGHSTLPTMILGAPGQQKTNTRQTHVHPPPNKPGLWLTLIALTFNRSKEEIGRLLIWYKSFRHVQRLIIPAEFVALPSKDRHDWATSLSLFTFLRWRRKWQPTPVFLPGESQGRGSLVGCHLWVAQSWKRLKQLSSSSSSF